MSNYNSSALEVACKETAELKRLGRELRRVRAEKMIREGMRTIDICARLGVTSNVVEKVRKDMKAGKL